jgi:hypothetical protein
VQVVARLRRHVASWTPALEEEEEWHAWTQIYSLLDDEWMDMQLGLPAKFLQQQ